MKRDIKYLKLHTSLAGLFLFVIFLLSYFIYTFYFLTSSTLLSNINFNLILSIVSAFLFALLIGSSLVSRAFYFLLLPIVVLNIPNAVNDFVPSFWSGPTTDNLRATMPIFTHIDIYLILGILRFLNLNHVLSPSAQKLYNFIFLSVLIIFISMILSWLTSAIYTNLSLSSLLFFGNNFQIRYLLFICLFVRFVNSQDVKYFLIGLSIASVFVIFEASIYRYIYGYSSLTSGNYGTNTLAVLLGFIFLILKNFFPYRGKLKILLLGFLLFSLILTGTKTAILSLILVLVIGWAENRISFIRLFGILSLIICAFFIFYYEQIVSIITPLVLFFETTDYSYLVQEGMAGGALSSLLTRFYLWWTSFNILLEYPFGIGADNFNYLKFQYGFSIPVFIDPHNDYINSLVEYGWLGGFVFLGLLYVYPYFRFKKYFDKSELKLAIAPLYFLLLTSLTNSNLNKHQFFFIVIFYYLISILGFLHNYKNILSKDYESK